MHICVPGQPVVLARGGGMGWGIPLLVPWDGVVCEVVDLMCMMKLLPEFLFENVRFLLFIFLRLYPNKQHLKFKYAS